MNFATAKEHLGLLALGVIIAWSGAQLHRLNETAQSLAEAIVAMKQNDGFQDYRLNQHRDQIVTLQSAVSDNKVRIGRLEIKVFGSNPNY